MPPKKWHVLFGFHGPLPQCGYRTTTGSYWLRKVFAALDGYQESIVLGDVFWLDETFLSVKASDARRKRDGTLPKGLSRNKLCIVTATDGKREVVVWAGYGKPSRKRILRAMRGHLRPGSRMIDDGEKSHAVLCERLGVARESHPTSETKGLPDARNPLRTVNALHALFKLFMRSHGGLLQGGDPVLVRPLRLHLQPPRRQAELRQGHDSARDFHPQGDEIPRGYEEKADE